MANFSIEDLSNLINLTGSFSGDTSSARQDQRTVQKDIFDTYLTKINSTFDNELIQREIDRMESHVSQNQSDMSDAMWDKYNYIKDKSKYNMEDNNYFDVYSRQIDSQANEFNEIMNTYNDSSQEEKDAIVGDLQTRVLDFVSNKNIMKRKFGTRLSKPEYHTEALKLSEYDELFQYGVASLTDDQYLSKDEGAVFYKSIVAGDATHMRDYMIKETNHKVDSAKLNYQDGMTMIDQVNYFGDLLDKIDDIDRLDLKIKNMPTTNEDEIAAKTEEEGKYNDLLGRIAWTDLSNKDNPISFTYEQLFLGEADIIADNAQSSILNMERQLKNRAKGYLDLTGQNLFEGNPITYSKWNWSAIPTSELEEVIDNNVKNNTTPPTPPKLNLAGAPKDEQDLVNSYMTEKAEYDEIIAWLKANPYTGGSDPHYDLRNKYNYAKKQFQKKWLSPKGGSVIKDAEGNIVSDYRKATKETQAQKLIQKYTK